MPRDITGKGEKVGGGVRETQSGLVLTDAPLFSTLNSCFSYEK